MSLEIKLGDEEMGFWNKHKKKVIGPLVAGMIATGVAGGVDKSHNGDINFGTPSASAATSAQASVNYKLPGAIAADPDWAVHDAWGAMKTGTGHSLYNLYGKDYAIAVLKLDSNANVGTQFKKVDELTMQTSHAYVIAAAKVQRLGSWIRENYMQNNPSLAQYTKATGALFHKNYSWAKRDSAYGIFIATSVGADEFRDAKAKSEKFMNASVTDKEIMLRQEFAKFSKTKANPANRDVNSMEYKMRSAYYNLGMYILADYNNGNKDEALTLRNTKGNAYTTIGKKFGFNSASSSLL